MKKWFNHADIKDMFVDQHKVYISKVLNWDRYYADELITDHQKRVIKINTLKEFTICAEVWNNIPSVIRAKITTLRFKPLKSWCGITNSYKNKPDIEIVINTKPCAYTKYSTFLHEIGHVVFDVNNIYKKDEYKEYVNLTSHTKHSLNDDTWYTKNGLKGIMHEVLAEFYMIYMCNKLGYPQMYNRIVYDKLLNSKYYKVIQKLENNQDIYSALKSDDV